MAKVRDPKKDKREKRETNQAVVRQAMIRRLPRRLGAQGRMALPAAPALLDAVLASIVGDDLERDEADELMAPWLETVERPAPVADAWATTDD